MMTVLLLSIGYASPALPDHSVNFPLTGPNGKTCINAVSFADSYGKSRWVGNYHSGEGGEQTENVGGQVIDDNATITTKPISEELLLECGYVFPVVIIYQTAGDRNPNRATVTWKAYNEVEEEMYIYEFGLGGANFDELYYTEEPENIIQSND